MYCTTPTHHPLVKSDIYALLIAINHLYHLESSWTQAKGVNLFNVDPKYHDFVLFMYTTGLRTGEAIKAFNDHSTYCNNGILELYWNRSNRKIANATYCLCNIKPYNRWSKPYLSTDSLKNHVNSRMLGFEPRYLRHLNFTINANKINPLLAEFIQGRRGSISEKHYYISLLTEFKQKWIDVWTPIIQQIL